MQFLLDHEYVFTLYFSLCIFLYFVPKRKYFYLYLIGSFFLIETYWHFRPLPGPLDFIMVYIMMAASLFLIFKTDIFRVLFILTTTFCVQHIAYKSTMIICTLINSDLRGEALYLILLLVFIMLTNGLIYALFLRKMEKNQDIVINNYYLLWIALLMLGADVLVSFYVEDPLLETEEYWLYSLVNIYAIILSLAGIFILFMSSKESTLENENKVLEIMMKNDEKRYELAKVAQEEINIKYHDLKHMIHDVNVSEDEMIEFDENAKIFKSIYFTGNKALDVVLQEKSLYCSKNGIQFLSIADGKIIDFMKTTHIYSLFSNLIDNAIESELKIEDVKKRLIRLNVSKQRNSVVITIENACLEAPTFKNGLPLTTKEDKTNHGFGTKSIKNIVERYKGYINFNWENEVFFVKIVLPVNDTHEVKR